MAETTTDEGVGTPTLPACDMGQGCAEPVTMLEEKGWVYCTSHGQMRRMHGRRARKLRPHELNRLKRGEQIAKY